MTMIEPHSAPDMSEVIARAEAEIAAMRAGDAFDPHAKLREHIHDIDGIMAMPDPEWLVEDIIPQEGVGVMWGESGTYKSFLALDLGLRIASGLHAWERRTACTNVLYMAGEGVAGMRKRITAWRAAHPGADPTARFLVGTYPPPLAAQDQLWAQAMADVACEMAAQLTIIDTVARHFGGADENSTQDMGLFVMALDRIKTSTGGAVLCIHHSGTERSRMRGNTSLYAAADYVLAVSRPARGWVTMSNSHEVKGKAKDAEEMQRPAAFRLDKVAESLVPAQVDPDEVPSASGGDRDERQPRALGTDRLARINTVVEAIRAVGGSIASTSQLMERVGWRSWEKAEKALAEAAEIGAIHCERGARGAKVWHLVEGWDR